MAPCQEANGDNLGVFLIFYTVMVYNFMIK